MKSLKVSLIEGFELSMVGPRIKGKRRRERLVVRNADYSRLYLSQFLFSQLGLMHLLAPYFPKIVKTNFLIHPPFQDLIGKMYQSCGRIPPQFETQEGYFDFGTFPETSAQKVVIAYSGGKDSMWNLWWAQE